MIKRLAALLPHGVQQTLRRWWYRVHIRRGKFVTDEPEFRLLEEWIAPGDWVIDVGANVGIYTRRMSELVGPSGRVLALEPIPSTFELLASNTADLDNVTLIQAAAVAENEVVRMAVPTFDNGLSNMYQAQIDPEGEFSVFGIELSSLQRRPPALVKIDAEGHDLDVLKGMSSSSMVPVLIVEDDSGETVEFLTERGYSAKHLADSPNTVWRA